MQSGAAAAFTNRLLIRLPNTVPDVDPAVVIGTGATELRIFGTSLHSVRIAYMDGIKVAFALGCASMGVAFILALFSRRSKIGGEAARNAMGAGA
jgi:hypothetical protein